LFDAASNFGVESQTSNAYCNGDFLITRNGGTNHEATDYEKEWKH